MCVREREKRLYVEYVDVKKREEERFVALRALLGARHPISLKKLHHPPLVQLYMCMCGRALKQYVCLCVITGRKQQRDSN